LFFAEKKKSLTFAIPNGKGGREGRQRNAALETEKRVGVKKKES